MYDKEKTVNLDELIAKGFASGDPLTIELARNLQAWRLYAVELNKGVSKLQKLLDPTDNLRRAGL